MKFIFALCLPIVLGFTYSPYKCFKASTHHKYRRDAAQFFSSKMQGGSLSSEEVGYYTSRLLELSSMHFTSQAIHTFTILGIPDILGSCEMSLHEICQKLSPTTNKDALARTMKLIVPTGIVVHVAREGDDYFRLGDMGLLLQTQSKDQPSLACLVRHILEEPLWNAWLQLPAYILGHGPDMKSSPFERCNGQSSDTYYSVESHPQSLKFANDFVRHISNLEINSFVSLVNWSEFVGKTVLDIGGNNGRVLEAVANSVQNQNMTFQSLDLPRVIDKVERIPKGVELIRGNILDESTIPFSDIIIMKHFLDPCMWDDEQTITILKTCHKKTPHTGMLIIGDAVVPDFSDAKNIENPEIAMDALYMVVGRHGQRTESQWKKLANECGFMIEKITRTPSPTCSLIFLTKAQSFD